MKALLKKEFYLILRDVPALTLLFVMPAIFILILSLALEGVYLEKTSERITIAMVQLDHPSTETLAFHDQLAANPFLKLKVMSREDAVKFFEQGEVDGIIYLDDDFDHKKALNTAVANFSSFGRWQLDPAFDARVRSSFELILKLSLESFLVEISSERNRPVLSQIIRERLPRLIVESDNYSGAFKIPSPEQQNVPAWSLFAMFFISLPLSQSLLRERQNGTLTRLQSLKVPRWKILLAKTSPFFVINLCQFCLMILLGHFVLPLLSNMQLSLDVSFAHLSLVTCLSALASCGFGLLVASFARTPEQASILAAISIIIFAAIGGLMVPQFVMPEFMQEFSQISPLYWPLKSYLAIFKNGYLMKDDFKSIGFIGLFAGVFFVFALAKFKWR